MRGMSQNEKKQSTVAVGTALAKSLNPSAVEVDRWERAGLADEAGETRWKRQAENLEQVGSLERDKPGSTLRTRCGPRRGRLDGRATKVVSGRGVKAHRRRREGEPGGGQTHEGEDSRGG